MAPLIYNGAVPHVMRFLLWAVISLAVYLTVVDPALALVRYASARTWVRTSATVLQADHPPKRRPRPTRYPQSCDLTFQYDVSGVTFTGRTTGFNSAGLGGGSTQGACTLFRTQRYPAPGDHIPIMFNPVRPEQAVAYPNFPVESWRSLQWGALGWGLAGLWWFRATRSSTPAGRRE